ncbi:MAG: hypothetical protein NC123_04545 [Butyrivibrio sp.]|nr:hypothetical protein [Acetatifactor muris]MCM1558797.1 hypothetical protein [Butyrivibrio sp.]
MRVSVCVGNYASTPYCVPGIEINVSSMEELCFVLKENAFLLDFSVMNDQLLDWIERECGLKELAKALHPLVHKKGSLSAFVTAILNFTGLYDGQTVAETEQVLKQGAGLSSIEKKKSQVDYLVKKKKYILAVRGYDSLIQKWQENVEEGEVLPAAECLASIWHNKGVALAGLMIYEKAAECFLTAYDMEGRRDFYRDYLAAKRLALNESEYVSFVAENTERYELTLELEKDMERLTQEWEQQPEYLRLNAHRELRTGDRKQKYYEENERLTQTLKDSYRKSVAD